MTLGVSLDHVLARIVPRTFIEGYLLISKRSPSSTWCVRPCTALTLHKDRACCEFLCPRKREMQPVQYVLPLNLDGLQTPYRWQELLLQSSAHLRLFLCDEALDPTFNFKPKHGYASLLLDFFPWGSIIPALIDPFPASRATWISDHNWGQYSDSPFFQVLSVSRIHRIPKGVIPLLGHLDNRLAPSCLEIPVHK
ncbi:hypothetical protein BV25DRAFT_1341591 [Artomyces pyxidatus]|uniref:Uncharacterized protein n=1 Tax=Artomyces pyxidatus TaxID=48021 RepID=A0ACB8SMS5_9AGAM|nr:hypothetical protein BV25DRAFT_1341591 [Artomyces pyxidatus]